MDTAAKNTVIIRLEMRLLNGRTGAYRWFLDKGAPRYINGKFAGFVGTTLDIHDRKEIEKELEGKVRERTNELQQKNEELQATKSFLEQLIDSSVEFISVLDKDLRFVTVNKKYEKAADLSRKHVQGKHLFEINPNVEGTVQHESILKALKGETIYLDKRKAVLQPELHVDTYFVPLVLQMKWKVSYHVKRCD
jgi:PAS domain-containing protein